MRHDMSQLVREKLDSFNDLKFNWSDKPSELNKELITGIRTNDKRNNNKVKQLKNTKQKMHTRDKFCFL
jgi:hypothetical protein